MYYNGYQPNYLNYPYGSYVGNQTYSQQLPYHQQVGMQMQNNLQSQQSTNQQKQSNNYIQCEYVDSIDVVKGQNCDMTGRPILYMKTDGSEIYRKQLNPSTGSGDLYIYHVQNNNIEHSEPSEKTNFNEDINFLNSKIEFFQETLNDTMGKFESKIDELKSVILEGSQLPRKGGVNK